MPLRNLLETTKKRKFTLKTSLFFLLGFSMVFIMTNCVSKKKKRLAHKPKPKPSLKAAHIPAPVKHKAHKPHWSYSGLFGPEAWGDIENHFRTCKTGVSQSPVDLVWKKPAKHSEKIEFHFTPTEYKVVNNGHTIKVSFPKGQWSRIRGEAFELLQLHFHSSSEHTIAGRHYPIEAHLVHKNSRGDLAVVGIMFSEGSSNEEIAKLWSHAPSTEGTEVGVKKLFNLNHLIPPQNHYYHYTGSLTTPPCSEGVNWNVFNTSVEVSKEQIAHFQQLYKGNFRPVQALNNRTMINY